MNLKRVSIRNEIFIRRDLSILHSIPHVGLNTDWIVSQVSFGIETNPDSCKLPLKPGFQSRHKHKHKVKHKKKQINSLKRANKRQHKHKHKHSHKTTSINYGRTKANSKENSFCFVFVKLRGKFILCYFAYVYVASENQA